MKDVRAAHGASDLAGLDLNLIRVFNAVMDERGVTKAAQRLRLTQSAVSHALGKLRQALGDELFLREPSGMHPTPRAQEIAPALQSAQRMIEEAISRPRFEPASADTEFSIATSDYIVGTFFPRFMRKLLREAPRVRLSLRPFNDLNIVEELDRGRLHLAMGWFGKSPGRFVREAIFTEPHVWLMRKGHPAASRSLALEDLAAFPHVDIRLSVRGASTFEGTLDQDGLERASVTSNLVQLDGLLAERGLSRQVGATVSHIMAVPALVAATDMIAFVPSALATASRSLGLVASAPPYAAPPLQISMLSHRVMGAHPSVAWLRKSLCEMARSDSEAL